eukprot:scaffold235718_cov33-Prasinocladus_malaysianus.AAC.1
MLGLGGLERACCQSRAGRAPPPPGLRTAGGRAGRTPASAASDWAPILPRQPQPAWPHPTLSGQAEQ